MMREAERMAIIVVYGNGAYLFVKGREDGDKRIFISLIGFGGLGG